VTIDRPTSLVNLLTYSDTERAWPGSRWCFRVTMGFSDEYRILIANLYISKGYRANFRIKVGDWTNS